MPTLFDPSARQKMIDRWSHLTPETRPLWGRMDAARMQAHVGDQLRSAMGDIQCRPKGGPFRYFPIRELLIYVLPWPKGLPTAPEMKSTKPADFESDRKAVVGLLEQVGTRKPGETWGEHPAFGKISRRAWGVLCWRHTDHHLRQFGL